MNAKQQAFLEHYFQLWNATQAAEKAGYAHARQAGSRLLSHVDIQQAIEARLAELKMTADEVLVRLAAQARFDPLQHVTIYGDDRVGIDLESIRKAGAGSLVKKIFYDRNGFLTVEFYDGQKALKLIGQHHKLFTQRHEVSMPDLEPLPEMLAKAIEKVYGNEKPSRSSE